jgi:hypothetical protein
MQMASARELTEPQRRFASREAATPGVRTFVGVFFYRHSSASTRRWLVDPRGAVLETSVFPGGR